MNELPQKVLIREVGPRDGLQNEAGFVSTKTKVQLIKALVNTGLKAVEITSFVRPDAVPQFKDAEELCAQLELDRETVFSALVGNAKGVERALKIKMPELVCVISASEAHNKYNLKMTVNQSLQQLKEIASLTKGLKLVLRGAVATAFGCPYQGTIGYGEIERIIDGMLEAGMKQLTLADTAGLANPKQVYTVVQHVKQKYPGVDLGLHFHDTRGMAMANVLAGLEAGIEIFEGSISGAGGCPFISGAAGNIATEDMIYMLHRMGIFTGIDLDSLVQSARFLEEILGHHLPGRLMRSGTF